MDRTGNWRPIEPTDGQTEEAQAAEPARPAHEQQGFLRLIVAGVLGAAILVAAAVALWAATPQPQVVLQPSGQPGAVLGDEFGASPGAPVDTPDAGVAEVLVDVQGAVARPGLHRLPEGSRLGDAIAAAGGYGLQVDIRAAAERLNLAERLTDGAKIYVPARGDPTQPPAPSPPAAAGGGAPGATDLIEINGASQAQLETLPGIGPVTAGKIIAAREEAPFNSVDELLSRKVVGPATFEKVRALVTVAP
jgi:competence protein ComEA